MDRDPFYTDSGIPGIRRSALQRLALRERNFGWTVEMQIKALRQGLRIEEVHTSYRQRIGRSKISRIFRRALGAGAKILFVVFRSALQRG